MAIERVAVDTNLLVYAFGGMDPKGARASAALMGVDVVSVQALNEFTDVMRRKYGRDDDEIETGLRYFASLMDVVAMTERARQAGFHLARRSGLRIYDAMIVATAADSGCTRLLTEDMRHGTSFLGVAIENPFRDL